MATKNLKIGSALPAFNLKGVDEKLYTESSFSSNKILVVIFSCNHCPYVQAYEDRMKEIQGKYDEEQVRLIAINSNDESGYPEDSFENMKKRAKDKSFNFLYLRDEVQSVAREFDASHTPEVFVFDEERKLRYHGKIDDNWREPDKVRAKYLRDAIEELLKGEEISVPETYSIGCTIKWKQAGVF